MGLVEKKGKNGAVMEQVQALQAAGKIKADTAINAIMASIKESVGGGNFGDVAAAKASGSVTGLIGKLMNLKDSLLSNISIDWSPIMGGIEKVMAALESPAATKFFSAVGEAITGVLKELSGSVSGEDMSTMFTVATAAVHAFAWAIRLAISIAKALKPIVMGVGGFLVSMFAPAIPLVMAMGGAFLNMISIIGNLPAVLTTIGAAIAGFFSWVWGGITSLASSIWGFVTGVAGAVSGFFSSVGSSVMGVIDSIVGSATTLGSQMIDGIVSGIESGASAVVDAMVGVATGAIDAAESALGIASPSKVMERIYELANAGAVRGTDKTAARVAEASAATATDATAAARGAYAPSVPQQAGASVAANAGRAGGASLRQAVTTNNSTESKRIDIGGINVHSSQADPKRVASETVNAFQSAVDGHG